MHEAETKKDGVTKRIDINVKKQQTVQKSISEKQAAIERKDEMIKKLQPELAKKEADAKRMREEFYTAYPETARRDGYVVQNLKPVKK